MTHVDNIDGKLFERLEGKQYSHTDAFGVKVDRCREVVDNQGEMVELVASSKGLWSAVFAKDHWIVGSIFRALAKATACLSSGDEVGCQRKAEQKI